MNKAVTLLNYNFKGGVGKTTLTGMQAYLLADQKKKVLCVDIDPQANLTEMVAKTYKVHKKPYTSFYEGFSKGDLGDTIVHINDNLDIIPGDWNLNKLVNRLAYVGKNRRWILLRDLLEPLKSKYDYILLDVPPTLNDIVYNAIFAADGISIVLQTQTMAYTSAIKTIEELIKLHQDSSAKFQFLGVVLYLYSKAKVDRQIVDKAHKALGDALYDVPIKFQERVKGFTSTGIKDRDHWDKRAIGNYYCVNKAILKRAKKAIK